MQFYLRVGKNSKIIRPGDFFIGLTGQNHTYEQILPMSAKDKRAIGIYDFAEDYLDYGFDHTKIFQLCDVDEVRNMKIFDNFMFRDERYSCSARDIYLVNSLLAIANTIAVNPSDVGNLNWLDDEVPFFWYNEDGHIRNMDVATFRDFAKNMTLHIMAHNIAAKILQERITAGEEVDIRDSAHWPEHVPFTPVNADNYRKFAKKLIELKYGSAGNIDSDYQNQINDIASMIE